MTPVTPKPLARYYKPKIQRVTKRTVNYRPSDGERDCGNCIMFHAGSCDLVFGKISKTDVCDRWEAK